MQPEVVQPRMGKGEQTDAFRMTKDGYFRDEAETLNDAGCIIKLVKKRDLLGRVFLFLPQKMSADISLHI